MIKLTKKKKTFHQLEYLLSLDLKLNHVKVILM